MGEESIYAVAIPVTRFVAPGPDVAKHTPVLQLALAYPSAIWAADCSCLQSICLKSESHNSSYMGNVAPPGSPNIVSTFSLLKASNNALLPDITSILSPFIWFYSAQSTLL